MSEQKKKLVAYHEAGWHWPLQPHMVVGYVMSDMFYQDASGLVMVGVFELAKIWF